MQQLSMHCNGPHIIHIAFTDHITVNVIHVIIYITTIIILSKAIYAKWTEKQSSNGKSKYKIHSPKGKKKKKTHKAISTPMQRPTIQIALTQKGCRFNICYPTPISSAFVISNTEEDTWRRVRSIWIQHRHQLNQVISSNEHIYLNNSKVQYHQKQ